jgi:hypothetical protein
MDCEQHYRREIIKRIAKIVGFNPTDVPNIGYVEPEYNQRTSARYLKTAPNKTFLMVNKNNPQLDDKPKTNNWGQKLVDRINEEFMSDKFGTVAYIDKNISTYYTEISWNIPKELIEEYKRINGDEITEVDYSPATLPKVNRFQNEINKITDRISTLKRNLNANKSDRTKFAEISAKIKTLEEREAELIAEDKLANVVSFGNSDMDDVEKILNKDEISTSDLFYANKILHQWNNVVGTIFDANDLERTDGQYSLNVQAVNNIELRAKELSLKYTKVFENTVMNIFLKQGVTPTKEQIFGAKKEIDILQANLRDISMTNDVIFQVTSKIIKEANFKTEQEVIKTVKEVDALMDAVKKTVEYKQKGFDIFAQEDKDGKKTGMMTSRFSDVFYKESGKRRDDAKKTGNWEDFFKWKKENNILFDLRKLFYNEYKELDGGKEFSEEDITAHINDLKLQLGEKGYQEYYDRLQAKFDLYKKDLEAQKEYISSLEADQSAKDAMMEEWLLTNSPFVYAERVYEGKKIKLGEKFINPKGYKYTSEVPRRFTPDGQKTNWHDAKFDVIQDNPALYDYYKYTIDKFNELRDYLPDSAVEDLQYNYIPEIRKNIAELFSDKGIKGGLDGWYDKIISELTTSSPSGISYEERDPETGELIKTLPISMVGKNLKADEKSYDLARITKAFSIMALSFKHKSEIEDSIRLLEQVVNNSKEAVLNPDGTPKMNARNEAISVEGKLKNYRAQYNYAVEALLYNKRRIEEGVSKTKKLLNTEEKAIKADLEKQLAETTDEDAKKEIQAKIDELGSNVVASKVWDKVIQFAQLKGMGWNLFAPVNNTVVGFISNLIHASGNEDYTAGDYLKAYRLMLNSVGKSASLDALETKTAKKINNMMVNFNVVGEIDQAGYNSTAFESGVAKGLQKLSPYELTKRAEYLNQGSTFVAMLLNKKIKDLQGNERSMWEAYDEEGNWKTDEFPPQSEKEKSDFKIKLEQVKKIVHGNYDPSSPVAIKKVTLGRAVTMFRNWVAEGFAARFEGEKEDLLLGRSRKGRFITLKEQGLVQGPMLLLSQMANFLTFGGAFKTSLDSLSEVDKANMRKNAMEMLIYLHLYMLTLILKSLDSDDDDEKKALNYLININLRTQNDMAFFTSPLAFEKITQSSIPAMSIITDAAKLVQATQKTITGDPYYKTGIHKGDLRIRVAAEKNIPFLTQIERLYQGTSKAME